MCIVVVCNLRFKQVTNLKKKKLGNRRHAVKLTRNVKVYEAKCRHLIN